jgi:hypothetical protein
VFGNMYHFITIIFNTQSSVSIMKNLSVTGTIRILQHLFLCYIHHIYPYIRWTLSQSYIFRKHLSRMCWTSAFVNTVGPNSSSQAISKPSSGNLFHRRYNFMMLARCKCPLTVYRGDRVHRILFLYKCLNIL